MGLIAWLLVGIAFFIILITLPDKGWESYEKFIERVIENCERREHRTLTPADRIEYVKIGHVLCAIMFVLFWPIGIFQWVMEIRRE